MQPAALRAAPGLPAAHHVLLHALEGGPQAVPEVLGPAGLDQLIGRGHAPGAPAEHHVAQAQQALPDAPGVARTLGNAGKVAEQLALQAALSQRLNPS